MCRGGSGGEVDVMGLKYLVDKTSIANIVAGIVVVSAVVYCFVRGDTDMLRNLALISAGWLFGTTASRYGAILQK